MPFDERAYFVRSMLLDYVKSPSLRHIRDPHFAMKLATDIVKSIDRAGSIWQKWEGEREPLLKSAARCWIPIEDLRAFLNRLPGPPLTTTDVQQKLRAVHEGPFAEYPDDRMRDGCLAIYVREQAQGTEIAAIIGALEEFVEREDERIRRETAEQLQERAKQEKEALKQRLLAGADCNWTSLESSSELFRRSNGRLYRLTQGKDKRWTLSRLASVDERKGTVLGQYLNRGDASKAVSQLAYQPETRW
ncbi:MAG: hypothetical protein EOP84_00680 [Verrucomicrobiaceae bacterium]|nr:MAG: hypothetical protein EOP84_00680 [Verrucomicrobiaceae bacterium]